MGPSTVVYCICSFSFNLRLLHLVVLGEQPCQQLASLMSVLHNTELANNQRRKDENDTRSRQIFVKIVLRPEFLRQRNYDKNT